VKGRLADGTTITLAMPRDAKDLESDSAGISVPLLRPATSATIDQIRVTLKLKNATGTLRLRHLALYPAAPPVSSSR